MESIATIPQPSLGASSNATADLPDEVGPVRISVSANAAGVGGIRKGGEVSPEFQRSLRRRGSRARGL